MTFLVTDAALDGHRPEHLVDRLAQRLGAVDHAQHALVKVKTPGDEV